MGMGYFISLLEYFIGIGFIFFLHFHFHFHSHSHFSSPFCKLTAERVGFIFSHYQIGVFFLITLGQAWTDGRWWVGEQLENLEWIRGKVFFFFLFLLLLFTSKGKFLIFFLLFIIRD